MKFWQKLYLSTLSLFLIVFVSSILMVVHSIYKNNLEMEKQKGNRDAWWLAERLSEDFKELAEGRAPDPSDVTSLLSSYSYNYAARNSLFSLYENGELIYTTLSFDDSSLLPSVPSDGALSRVYWLEKQCFYCIYLPVSEDYGYQLLYFMNWQVFILFYRSCPESALLRVLQAAFCWPFFCTFW